MNIDDPMVRASGSSGQVVVTGQVFSGIFELYVSARDNLGDAIQLTRLQESDIARSLW